MTWLPLGRSTPVPIDRDILVAVRFSWQSVDPTADIEGRIDAELKRHLSVSSTYQELRGSDEIRYAKGIPYRAWTRAELEGQLRALSLPFTSVSVQKQDTTPSFLERVGNRARTGGVSGALSEAAEPVLGSGEPMATDRKPLVFGLVALVLGALVLGWALWSSR